MTVSETSNRHKVHLRYLPDATPARVFLDVQSYLHSSVGSTEIDKHSINSIILQTFTTFSFDTVERQVLIDSRNQSKDKLLDLFSRVENRNQTYPTTLNEFLNLLVNLEGLEQFSEGIQKRIRQNFRGHVEIVPEDTQQSLPALPTSNSSHHLLNASNSSASSENNNKSHFLRQFLPGVITLIISVSTAIMLWIYWAEIVLAINAATSTIPDPVNKSNAIQSVSNTTFAPKRINSTAINNVSGEVATIEPPQLQHLDRSPVTPPPTTIETTEASSLKKHKLRFHISSYEEYSQFMRSIPQNREVILSISLSTPLDWPQNDIPLINSFEISKLSLDGPLTVYSLINILKQTPNIQHLHLKNTGNKLCGRNQGQLSLVKSIQDTVYLPVLEKMVIQDFTACHEVYETLATYFQEMRELKGLVIYRGVVEGGNHFFIEKFISRAKTSLRYLMLPETQILTTVPFLEVSNGMRLYKLNMLRMDSMGTNGTAGIIPIGNKLSNIFPNLKYLMSEHGNVKWRNVSNILDHRNLTRLQIGIEVPEGHNQFSVSFLRSALPLLKMANITLKFKECNVSGSDGRNSLLGWETVKDTLEVITIRSNCKVHADFTKTPALLRKYREEKYSKEGGMHVFTYRLLDNRK